jgi:hypothetical protein
MSTIHSQKTLHFFITLLAFLITTSSYGQTRFGLKVYQNTDIFSARYYDSQNDKTTKHNYVKFNRISVAFNLYSKRRLVHEIEVLLPEISKSTDRVNFPLDYEFKKMDSSWESIISTYSLRYELSKILTEPSKRLIFSLGFGANPYLTNTEYTPNIPNTYYSNTRVYGLSLNLIPRVTFKVSNNVNIDLNIPFKLYDFKKEETTIKNPNIPIHQQTSKNTHGDFFEKAYSIRLGVGVLF